MKVAHVVCTDAFAGVERYVANLAMGMSLQGCETTILGGDGERIERSVKQYPGIDWLPAPTVGDAARLLRRMKKGVDLVHAHMTAAEFAAVLADPRGCSPLISTRHFAARRGSTLGGRLAGYVIGRRVVAQVSVSAHVARSVEGPSVVIHPGVPLPRYIPDSSGRERAVLIANRMEPEKRTEVALSIWQRSALAEDGWKLWVAGSGQELTRLIGVAESLGIASSCDFMGFVDDLEALQRRAAIFLSAAPSEHFGLAVVEAMAHELPVVATAAGGHLETAGLVRAAALYRPESVEEGALHLRRLASDDEARLSYGRALRKAYEGHFTLQPQADAMLSLYRSVLG